MNLGKLPSLKLKGNFSTMLTCRPSLVGRSTQSICARGMASTTSSSALPETLRTTKIFSSATRLEVEESRWEAVLQKVSPYASDRKPFAQEISDLSEASHAKEKYDKILIFINHGEDESQVMGYGHEGRSKDPALTRRGIGQTLDLSRKMATFCNDSTRLVPDLIVMAPQQRSLQTALLALPQYGPQSVRNSEWICNQDLMLSVGTRNDLVKLKIAFPGVDFSLCRDEALQSRDGMLDRTTRFLEWLKGRDDRIIVGTYSSRLFSMFVPAFWFIFS